MAESSRDTSVLPIADMLDIILLISRVEPLDVLLQKIASTVSNAFRMKYVTVGALDEKTGLFCIRALHGYPPEKEAKLKEIAYTYDRMRSDLTEQFRIGRSYYYVNAENRPAIFDDDMAYSMNPEQINTPRASTNDWHELDFIDFILTDRLGNWIGYLEINEPEDGKVPPREVLDRIEVLSQLAAIAIENSKMYEEAVATMNDAQGYLDLIIHDIGNIVNPLLVYLDVLARDPGLDGARLELSRKSYALASSAKELVDNVRKFSEAKSTDSALDIKYDIAEVLDDCIQRVQRAYPHKNVVAYRQYPERPSYVMADNLIYDLFVNIIGNGVKHNLNQTAELNLSIVDGYSTWMVIVEDFGRGIPDERKQEIFRRFAKRPDDVGGTGLGLSIVNLLADRYNGLVSIRDRVRGDYTKGACFEVALPKAT